MDKSVLDESHWDVVIENPLVSEIVQFVIKINETLKGTQHEYYIYVYIEWVWVHIDYRVS
jgi:hypothetical protein